MNDILIAMNVPSVSYAKQIIKDILVALQDYSFESTVVNYDKLYLMIDNVRINCVVDGNASQDLNVDFAFGFNTADTLRITDGKQFSSVHNFTGLIEYIKANLCDYTNK